jgi:hypothetical protein
MSGVRLGLFALTTLVAATPAAAQPGSDQSLHTYVQGLVGDRASDPDARYALGRADLNGDGREEALVLMQARSWCGTGGCTLFVLTPVRGGWRTVTRMTVTSAPVRVLATRSRGWRDLAVAVGGGGIRGGEAILRFNGRTYPSNPTSAPIVRRRTPAGRVLISGEDQGRPLFR